MIPFALTIAALCVAVALLITLLSVGAACNDSAKEPGLVVAVVLAIALTGLGWAGAHHTYKLAQAKACAEASP